jgi:hypothetical protein
MKHQLIALLVGATAVAAIAASPGTLSFTAAQPMQFAAQTNEAQCGR